MRIRGNSPSPWLSLATFFSAAALFAPTIHAQATPAAGPQSSTASCSTISSAPPLPPPLAEAQDLARSGKYDEAIAAYSKIAESGGTSGAMAYSGISRIYLKEKKPAAALEAAQKAVALTPGKPPAIVALGEVYFRLGRMPEAEELFLSSIRQCAPDARAFLGMAHLSRMTSNHLRAKHELDWAHQIDPNDPDITREWAFSLSREDRIKFLRDRLAQAAGDDDDAREGFRESLAVLLDQSANPGRGCAEAAKVEKTAVRLQRLMGDATYYTGYALDVKLNGQTAHLQLDTGASGILINPKMAEKAGIKPITKTEVEGFGNKGMMGGFVGNVDSVKVGDLEFQKCYVEVTEKKLLPDSDGLIGGDVFSHFLVDIDFPDAMFKLSALPAIPGQTNTGGALESNPASSQNLHDRYIAPEMKNYTQIYRFGHDILVPTRVNDSPAKLFLLDTGSFDNLISRNAAKESTQVSGDPDTEVKGLSGKVNQVYRASSVTLTFSHLKQRHDDMIAFDMTRISDADGTEISGVLGFTMLRLLDITIDYRDGLVDFQYDPHRLH
jgi:tetratricopeptide (TPR) repeat protein